jgi:hypothetical protein
LKGLANIFSDAKKKLNTKKRSRKPTPTTKKPTTRKPIPTMKPKSSKVTTPPTTKPSEESQQGIDNQEFNKPNIDGSISIIGLKPAEFNPLSEQIQFMLSGAEFGEVSTLLLGGELIHSSLYTIDANKAIITVNYKLKDGENKVYLKAFDTFGRPTIFMETYWAGSINLAVNLLKQPVSTSYGISPRGPACDCPANYKFRNRHL